MSVSKRSTTSQHSNRILEEVAAKSTAKIYNIEGVFSDEQVRVAWNALGLYVAKNLRMGRGVNVPKLGIFTFTPPQGVTNPSDRDTRPRNPVFIINKEFVRGKEIKSGIFYQQEFGAGIRAYTMLGANGEVPIAKMNFVEVASFANMSKDSVELAVNRVIKYLSEKTSATGNISIDIPSIGVLLIRNNMAAVKFSDFLTRDTRTVLSMSLNQRRGKANNELTSDNLKKFAALAETSTKLAGKPLDFLKIDDSAKNFIQTNFGFHFDDSHNLRRTITGFDRSFATKQYSSFNNNSSILKSRLSNSGFYPANSRMSHMSRYQSNLALQVVKNWAASSNFNHHQKSYVEFVYLAKQSRDPSQTLLESDVWVACKQISVDITEQQAHQLFRVLDANKDGVVDVHQWKKVFQDDSQSQLEFILNHARSLNLNSPLLEQTAKATGFKNLKENDIKSFLKQLTPELKGEFTDEQLTEALKKYDWKSNLLNAFVETLRGKFPTLHEAFKHLCQYNKASSKLCFSQFEAAIKEIMGGKFTREEIYDIWGKISNGESMVGEDRFEYLFASKWTATDPLNKTHPRDEWVYKDFDIIKGTVTRSLKHDFAEKDAIQKQCRKFAENVKQILRTSPKTLEEAFFQVDKEKKGNLTNLEFKHAFRILNIALTSKEIDLLLNFCQFNNDKYINWRQFINRFELIDYKKDKPQLNLNTSMQRFSDLLHYYMITPKDAYRNYNDPSTGYLSFQQFYNLCKDLYALAKDDVLPDFPTIKTLFDFIDVRKDGRLDYQQWVQTFRNFNPPSMIQGTRAPTTDKLSKEVRNTLKDPVRNQVLPSFEQSQTFEQLTELIGRNRKFLYEKFQNASKYPLIEFAIVHSTLQALAQQQGAVFPVEVYKNFVAFAMTGEKVDYKLLLQAFKQRSETIKEFPKQKVF